MIGVIAVSLVELAVAACPGAALIVAVEPVVADAPEPGGHRTAPKAAVWS